MVFGHLFTLDDEFSWLPVSTLAHLFLHVYKVAFSSPSGAISKLFPDCSFQEMQSHLELSLANADSIHLKFLMLTVGKLSSGEQGWHLFLQTSLLRGRGMAA